jgi:hypothetical protein
MKALALKLMCSIGEGCNYVSMFTTVDLGGVEGR